MAVRGYSKLAYDDEHKVEGDTYWTGEEIVVKLNYNTEADLDFDYPYDPVGCVDLRKASYASGSGITPSIPRRDRGVKEGQNDSDSISTGLKALDPAPPSNMRPWQTTRAMRSEARM